MHWTYVSKLRVVPIGACHAPNCDSRPRLQRQDDEVSFLDRQECPELSNMVVSARVLVRRIDLSITGIQFLLRAERREIGHFLPPDDSQATVDSCSLALSILARTNQPNGHQSTPKPGYTSAAA